MKPKPMSCKITDGAGFLDVSLVWAEMEQGPMVVSKCSLRGAGYTLAETNS